MTNQNTATNKRKTFVDDESGLYFDYMLCDLYEEVDGWIKYHCNIYLKENKTLENAFKAAELVRDHECIVILSINEGMYK